MKDRSSGILLHISSLAGDFGIGDFGEGAYNFVDFLSKANQKNWQILPLGITSIGDSPYQSFSAFAGNPYFIDLKEFIRCGYIDGIDLNKLSFGNNPKKVDYEALFKNKMKLLRQVYKAAKDTIYEELEAFYKENYIWLRDFALFMSIKSANKNISWSQWDREYQIYNSPKVLNFERENRDEIFFWIFTQYFFFKQWKKLKSYANSRGIKIIGDLPIYVSIDSADVWSKPYLYKLDENFIPINIAGVPPDDFTSQGQLWGNPIYNWDEMERENYKWWTSRIAYSFNIFDTLRIDHFRGFESFWEVEYGKGNAIEGKWTKGPGMKLFKKIKEELGDLYIIVEDLGYMTDDVEKLVKDTGFPNMKVLQFGLDDLNESDHMPHRFNKNMVAYTATHDNLTTMGWFNNASQENILYAMKYFKLNLDEGFNWGIIRGAWASTANLALAPMQDFLGLDNTSRMNTPSTIGENWTWRLTKDSLTEELALKIRELTKIYWR